MVRPRMTITVIVAVAFVVVFALVLGPKFLASVKVKPPISQSKQSYVSVVGKPASSEKIITPFQIGHDLPFMSRRR